MIFGGKPYTINKEYYLCMHAINKDKSNKKTTEQSDYMIIANKVMFTQMSAKVGFKKFSELSVAAMIKEFM